MGHSFIKYCDISYPNHKTISVIQEIIAEVNYDLKKNNLLLMLIP